MLVAPKYRCFSEGNWSLAVLPERWNQELRDRVLSLVEQQCISKHPQTLKLRYPDREGGDCLFLKIFHRARRLRLFKDVFRQSKAVRSLRQGLALTEAGFNVPTTVAAGELRSFALLERAFFLTLAVDAQPAPQFLRDRQRVKAGNISLIDKRGALRQLAEQIRRLHRLGFVHGDLVPTNILVSDVEGGGFRFVLIDNDRTRRYPCWVPQSLWKRNLVQLNRFPLPGISLQDRMRFFRAYVGGGSRKRQTRLLLRWLEKKTRQRRKECDAVDPTGSFRQLMRWQGEPSAKN